MILPKRKTILLFGLFLGSWTLSLALLEVCVRVISPQALAVPWQDSLDGIKAARPNTRGRHLVPETFDVTVTFNSQRFRGSRDYPLRPPAGVFRIAALGDSFTFGFGASDGQAYPAQLERILNHKRVEVAPDTTFEVINAANAGSGTGEQALWYERWVRCFNPHLVLLDVFVNDLGDDSGARVFYLDEAGEARPRSTEELIAADRRLVTIRRLVNSIPGYRFAAQHSHALAWLRNRLSYLFANLRSGHFSPAAEPVDEMNPGEPEAQALELLAAEVRWLHRRVRAEGSRLAVIFLPDRQSVIANQGEEALRAARRSNEIVNLLQDLCSREGIPFLDTTSALSTAASADPALFYQGRDEHPRPRGYRAIAEAVSQFLVAEALLP